MTWAMRHAEFIGTGAARLFLLAYAPRNSDIAHRCFVVAPAFAEEMNRSRDLLRQFGLAAAERGDAVVIPDLRGTGDSPGDFGDYGITDWHEDLTQSIAWTRKRFGGAPVTLLGLRFGALLTPHVSARADVNSLLLWQPVTEGRRMVREFLRIWSAANMGTGDDPRTMLQRDGSLEVAGYRVSSELIDSIEQLTLAPEADRALAIHWVEAGAALSVRSERAIAALRDAGHNVDTATADSPPFWRVQERVDASAFVAASAPGGAALDTHG
ncbi:MAG: hypothetical protein AAFY69_15720 [Pseudomonadota bacterium]